MLRSLLIAAMAAAFAVSLGLADQAQNKVVIPVGRTTPTSGKVMYASYCAPCHGIDGRGRGPAASALRMPPTDLTALSKNNRGRFPDTHVVSVLLHGEEIPVRGNPEMPTWGPILGKMNQSNPQDRLLRISNLSRYLEAIQVR